jgi:beta-lactamase class A
MIDRRTFLVASVSFSFGCSGPSDEGFADLGADPLLAAERELAVLRTGLGASARFGFAAVDTASGRSVVHDADSRYAMCSTFKWTLAAAILAEAEAGRLQLDALIPFGEADLLGHAPVVRENIGAGALPVERLCAAIVEVSDNSAANLLLRRIGGPQALTAFIRANGDDITRLDRYEGALNSNLPNDPRDTTTPAAMVRLMERLLVGDALTPASRTRLLGWMERSTTGLDRLRAGLPSGWRVGDKTGTGANGAHNDVAVAWPPARPPLLVASFISAAQASGDACNAAHAAAGRLAASILV